MLCPGRIARPVSWSGAPRKIDGMKSRKVWVIVIATINITRIIGEIGRRSEAEIEISKIEIKLICIPGIKPVNVPAVIPSKIAIINSINILL